MCFVLYCDYELQQVPVGSSVRSAQIQAGPGRIRAACSPEHPLAYRRPTGGGSQVACLATTGNYCARKGQKSASMRGGVASGRVRGRRVEWGDQRP